MRRIADLLLFSVAAPALGGFLLALAFPGYHSAWLAWIALVPVLVATRQHKPLPAFFSWWLCGLVFFVSTTWWWLTEFRSVCPLATALGYLYLSLYFALFGFFFSLIRRVNNLPLIIAAPVWVAFEYTRSHAGFLAFPLLLVGHTQYLNLPIIQIASVFGVYGVSFLIILTNAATADVMIQFVWYLRKAPLSVRPVPSAGTSFGICLAVLFLLSLSWYWGSRVMRADRPRDSLSVAVVQGNIPQKMKWNQRYREQILSHYLGLTEQAAMSRPALIVWPEASTPGFVLNDLSLLKQIASKADQSKAALLVGSAEYPKFTSPPSRFSKKRGNTALFISSSSRSIGQYVKMRLVPFGEYVPYEKVVPWPSFIVQREKRTFEAAGKKTVLFSLNRNLFGTLICWEILFPNYTRDLTRKGAAFIVNITNEAWFGNTAFPYQMLSSCVFRAVENRINVVRCANTGVSGFIDPVGRIFGRVRNGERDTFVSGTLTRQLLLSPPGTFFSRYGEIFAFGCIIASVALLTLSFAMSRQGEKSS